MAEKIMKIMEVAGRLGINRFKTYRLIKKGALAATKVGGQWRFTQSAVKSMVAKDKQLLKAGQAADIIGCHSSYIYKLAEKKKLSHARIGRSMRFYRQEVIKFSHGH